MYLEIGVPVFETSIEALIGCDWEKAAECSNVIDSKTIAKTGAAFLALGQLVSRIAIPRATGSPSSIPKTAKIRRGIHPSTHLSNRLLNLSRYRVSIFEFGTHSCRSERNARTIQGMACVEQYK